MCRLPLTLTDVLQRQTAESSRIHLDQRPHLERMSIEERKERRDRVKQKKKNKKGGGGNEDNEREKAREEG